MSTEEIREHLKNCIESLQAASKFHDFPSKTALRSAPYRLVEAQQSLEQALKELELKNHPGMLQSVGKALAKLPDAN